MSVISAGGFCSVHCLVVYIALAVTACVLGELFWLWFLMDFVSCLD